MKSKAFDGRVYELKYVTRVHYIGNNGICCASIKADSDEEARNFLNSTMKAIKSMKFEFIESSIKIERTLSKDRLEKRNG